MQLSLMLVVTLTLSIGLPFLPLLICIMDLNVDILPKPSELRKARIVPLHSTALVCNLLQSIKYTLTTFAARKDITPPDSLTAPSQRAPFANAKILPKIHQCIPFTNVSACQLNFINDRHFLSASF